MVKSDKGTMRLSVIICDSVGKWYISAPPLHLQQAGWRWTQKCDHVCEMAPRAVFPACISGVCEKISAFQQLPGLRTSQ